MVGFSVRGALVFILLCGATFYHYVHTFLVEMSVCLSLFLCVCVHPDGTDDLVLIVSPVHRFIVLVSLHYSCESEAVV